MFAEFFSHQDFPTTVPFKNSQYLFSNTFLNCLLERNMTKGANISESLTVHFFPKILSICR